MCVSSPYSPLTLKLGEISHFRILNFIPTEMPLPSKNAGGCFNMHDGLSDWGTDHSAMDK